MSMLLYAHYVISDEHAVICTLWYKWWACCYAKYVISDEHAVIHTVLSLNTLLSSLQEYSTLLEKKLRKLIYCIKTCLLMGRRESHMYIVDISIFFDFHSNPSVNIYWNFHFHWIFLSVRDRMSTVLSPSSKPNYFLTRKRTFFC